MNRSHVSVLLMFVFLAGVFFASEIEDECVRWAAIIGTFAAWGVSLYLMWPRKKHSRSNEE
jgi:O-antigen/teichoic acid export membrane protein